VLDLLVGRVALYPDPLLAQVMAAATFSEQIPAAAQWSAQHKYLKGDALVQAMEGANLGFDPSVQSLLAFPSVLDLMNRDLGWTQQFGDASLVHRVHHVAAHATEGRGAAHATEGLRDGES
jgi:hypothetical protein